MLPKQILDKIKAEAEERYPMLSYQDADFDAKDYAEYKMEIISIRKGYRVAKTELLESGEVSIAFAEWLEQKGWECLYSEELDKYAYVNALKVNILLNGSDWHYTNLINKCGKTTKELYTMFLEQYLKP